MAEDAFRAEVGRIEDRAARARRQAEAAEASMGEKDSNIDRLQRVSGGGMKETHRRCVSSMLT